MKILVISNYKDIHVVRPEAEIFISLAKRGYDITIMTYEESNYVAKFIESGIKVIYFHPEKKFDKKEIQFIREEVIKGKYDVMHLFNNVGTINGIKACKDLPVKIVLYRGYSANMHWWDPTSYLKHLNKRVDYIICNSIGVANDLIQNGKLPKHKAIVINKGHDLTWYEDIQPLDIKGELNLSNDAFLAILVANNRRMKGVKYLLEASRHLPTDANIHFLLVGNDLHTPENDKILFASPNKEKVHFLGYRKDALNIVKSSNVFVLTSIKGESITKSVLEAMSLGTPTIISDIAGNVELHENNTSGIVVPSKNSKGFAEAILKLYKNPDLASQFSLKSKERIETVLSHRNTVDKYEEFYKKIKAN
jgi:glycosyltransferase involved in cell wall biosynthesis